MAQADPGSAYPGAAYPPWTDAAGGYPGSERYESSYPAPLATGYRVQLPLAIRSPASEEAGTGKPGAAPDTAPGTAEEYPPPLQSGSCAGIATRRGEELVVDGEPFVFYGINVQYLTRPEFPESEVGPLINSLAARGVNTLRIWYFHDHDPDRLERLLDLGRQRGVRFVVVLEDNVFKGVDWFFGDEDEEDYRPHLERTVTRFKDRPEILFWEVMNEPNCGEGRHDDDCLKTIRDWLTMSSRMIKAIDQCHIVSTGMIGAGNYDNELVSYRKIHKKDSVEMISVHKRSTDKIDEELELAEDADRPLYYGEIYERAFDDGCSPLEGGKILPERAERIKSDFRQAIDDGVDGYLLWDFSAGRVERTDGKVVDYCSDLGYPLEDPVWDKILDSGDLPPPVPWR